MSRDLQQAFLIRNNTTGAVFVGVSIVPAGILHLLEQEIGHELELVVRMNDTKMADHIRDGYLLDGYTQQGEWLVPSAGAVAS